MFKPINLVLIILMILSVGVLYYFLYQKPETDRQMVELQRRQTEILEAQEKDRLDQKAKQEAAQAYQRAASQQQAQQYATEKQECYKEAEKNDKNRRTVCNEQYNQCLTTYKQAPSVQSQLCSGYKNSTKGACSSADSFLDIKKLDCDVKFMF